MSHNDEKRVDPRMMVTLTMNQNQQFTFPRSASVPTVPVTYPVSNPMVMNPMMNPMMNMNPMNPMMTPMMNPMQQQQPNINEMWSINQQQSMMTMPTHPTAVMYNMPVQPMTMPTPWTQQANILQKSNEAKSNVNNHQDSSQHSDSTKPLLFPVDLYETPHSYLYVFDVPGVPLHNIHISFTNQSMKVEITRNNTSFPFDMSHPTYIINFRRLGSESSEWTLPVDAESNRTRVKLSSGLLQILIPKKGQEDEMKRNVMKGTESDEKSDSDSEM